MSWSIKTRVALLFFRCLSWSSSQVCFCCFFGRLPPSPVSAKTEGVIRIRNKKSDTSRDPPPKKLKRELPNEKIGHELFEQATNEYAPVSHMTLPWLSWILSPFSCIQSFLINLTCTFFVSSLPFVAVTFNLDHCLYFCSVLNLEETAGYFLSIISTGGTLFLPRCHDLI